MSRLHGSRFGMSSGTSRPGRGDHCRANAVTPSCSRDTTLRNRTLLRRCLPECRVCLGPTRHRPTGAEPAIGSAPGHAEGSRRLHVLLTQAVVRVRPTALPDQPTRHPATRPPTVLGRWASGGWSTARSCAGRVAAGGRSWGRPRFRPPVRARRRARLRAGSACSPGPRTGGGGRAGGAAGGVAHRFALRPCSGKRVHVDHGDHVPPRCRPGP